MFRGDVRSLVPDILLEAVIQARSSFVVYLRMCRLRLWLALSCAR
jgi:hypothetical protein